MPRLANHPRGIFIPSGRRRSLSHRAAEVLMMLTRMFKIAGLAVQAPADVPLAPFFADDPGPIDPGRPMPDMLIVATLQLRYPVPLIVPMKCKNFTLHVIA